MPASGPVAPIYQRRQPEDTVLYRTVQAHLESFLAPTAADAETSGLLACVKRKFEASLRCGILGHGLVPVRCESWGDDRVVAFSGKGRGCCPSGGGRRVSELPAHLVDRVLPRVPVRQWVFTVPVPVRYPLACDTALPRAVLRVFLGTVSGWLRHAAARQGVRGGRGGAVTAIQRFGGVRNRNIPCHSLVLDGVSTRASAATPPLFRPAPVPTDEDIAELLARRQRRVRRLLATAAAVSGRAWGADGSAGGVGSAGPTARSPATAVAAFLQGRVTLGARAGQPVRRLRSAAAVQATTPRCARLEGVSFHADVAVPAHARRRLEHLCRYLLRPPRALERLTETSGGQLLYQLRRPWADRSVALLLTPLELLEPGRLPAPDRAAVWAQALAGLSTLPAALPPAPCTTPLTGATLRSPGACPRGKAPGARGRQAGPMKEALWTS